MNHLFTSLHNVSLKVTEICTIFLDMNSKIDLFRMNALRSIPIIIDPGNLV